MHEIAGVLKEQVKAMRMPAVFYPGGPFRESGVTLTKEVEIRAESFQELSAILGKFDVLAEEVECEHSAKKW